MIIEIPWKARTLANGLRIVHVTTDPKDRRAYLGAIVHAGTRFEGQNPTGTAHFLEHMMFRGSKKYPSFESLAEEFEWLGGEWNAETGHEHMEFSFVGEREGLHTAIPLFADFLQFPAFCDLERERQVILREIDEDLNDFHLSSDIDEHIANLFWAKSPLAAPIAGSKSSVNAITLDHLKSFRQQLYTPDRMVLACVSAHDSNEMLDLMEAEFSSYPAQRSQISISTPKAFNGPQLRMVPNTDSQYLVALSYRCAGESASETTTYELATRILIDGFSARMPQRMREELGIVYDVDVGLSQHSDCGTLDISAWLNPEDVLVFIKETRKIVADLASNHVSDNEIDKAKKRAQVDLRLLPSDPEAVGFRLAWAFLSNLDPYIATEHDLLMSVDKDKLQTVCQELFQDKNFGCIVMGPPDPELTRKLTLEIAPQTP